MLNRPYAFLQWVSQAAIPEKYVFMSEPDHIWLKPMPNLMKGQRWVGVVLFEYVSRCVMRSEPGVLGKERACSNARQALCQWMGSMLQPGLAHDLTII